MPEISIIVPVYNVEKYIHECIDSIINQSFTDIEIILVDDGSPDNCGRICDDYSRVDNRIKVIHQANGGLSNARNTGIKNANGKYIAFVDSDDIIDKNYCKILYEILYKTNYDFSVCAVYKFMDGFFSYPNQDDEEKIEIINNIDFIALQINKITEFGVWNKLYKKSVLEKIVFADGKLNEDVIFSAELAAKLNNKIISTNQKLYFYRQREGSIVANQSVKGSAHFIDAANHLINTSKVFYPHLYNSCVEYGVSFPWLFVDRIMVNKQLKNNMDFLISLQNLIRNNLSVINSSDKFSDILKFRMRLYSKSIFLYIINAYLRLLRVYLYKILRKDPYKDGHGI